MGRIAASLAIYMGNFFKKYLKYVGNTYEFLELY